MAKMEQKFYLTKVLNEEGEDLTETTDVSPTQRENYDDKYFNYRTTSFKS